MEAQLQLLSLTKTESNKCAAELVSTCRWVDISNRKTSLSVTLDGVQSEGARGIRQSARQVVRVFRLIVACRDSRLFSVSDELA